jgi:hypothetical protein
MVRQLRIGYCFVFVALAIFCGQWREHQIVESNASTASGSFGRQIEGCSLTADFDGDSEPDLAVGQNGIAGYTVQIRFTSHIPPTSLVFPDARPGIRIFTRDIDQDNDQDIIVSSITSDIPIAIWLGDGRGHFEKADPWAYICQGLKSPLQFLPDHSLDFSLALVEDGGSSMGASCGSPALFCPGLNEFMARENSRKVLPDIIAPFAPRGPPAGSPEFS